MSILQLLGLTSKDFTHELCLTIWPWFDNLNIPNTLMTSMDSCLCLELAANCCSGSSCEAGRVAGEHLVAFCKHMSLPQCFVLLPKDVDIMRLILTKTTMKQQGFCSWSCGSYCAWTINLLIQGNTISVRHEVGLIVQYVKLVSDWNIKPATGFQCYSLFRGCCQCGARRWGLTSLLVLGGSIDSMRITDCLRCRFQFYWTWARHHRKYK